MQRIHKKYAFECFYENNCSVACDSVVTLSHIVLYGDICVIHKQALDTSLLCADKLFCTYQELCNESRIYERPENPESAQKNVNNIRNIVAFTTRSMSRFSIFFNYTLKDTNSHKNSRSSDKIIFSPSEFRKFQKGFTSFHCFEGISLYFSIFVLIILTFFHNYNFNFTVELRLYELHFV